MVVEHQKVYVTETYVHLHGKLRFTKQQDALMQDCPDKLAMDLWLLWRHKLKAALSQPSINAQLATTNQQFMLLVSLFTKRSTGAQEKTAMHLDRPSLQGYLNGCRQSASDPTYS